MPIFKTKPKRVSRPRFEQKPKKISHVIMMGDSLSDRGTLNKRKLFSLIPMAILSGLRKRSPEGRFTNGYTWADQFSAIISEELIIQEQKEKGKRSDDIADEVINKSPVIEKALKEDFSLNQDTYVNFKGQDFIRNYDEGGMTSYDYSSRFTVNLKLVAEQTILSTLDQKRRLLLEDDKARGITDEHKKQSLVIEWSGANDLVTVNSKPTVEEAEKAVSARIDNIEKLIAHGYENFVLFNLPNLALTPRFKKQSHKEQFNAELVSRYFNKKLQESMDRLQKKYPHCNLTVFDVNNIFEDAYKRPQKHHLDPKKLTEPFVESEDFKKNEKHAPGYFFWDDLHPTATVHRILGDAFYEQYSKIYRFVQPHETLVQQFKENYGQKLENDLRGCFSFFKRSRIKYLAKDLTVDKILKHALYGGGKRTKKVLIGMGWIDKKGNLSSKELRLIHAMEKIRSTAKLERKQGKEKQPPRLLTSGS